MPRRRKCPTCWYEWLDKYNKAECPKCQSPLPDGEISGRRRIHTDRVNSRVGDIKKEKFVVEMYKQKSPRRSSKKEIQVRNKSVCPVTGGNHVWRFGKCRNCGVGEGYVRYSPSIPRPMKMTTSAMSRRGRQRHFDGTAETRKTLMFTRKDENYDSVPSIPTPSPSRARKQKRSEPKLIRKTCPVCAYRWLDKYRKNECPKCLLPLTGMRYGG